MKNKIITAIAIVLSALAHIMPAVGLAMIASGGEVADALGAMLLLCSSLALGYVHGMYRTLDNF